jgi:dTDP-glucose pyrophosphorylase
VDGMLQIFSDNQTRWSFVRMDNMGRVLQTAEKQLISNNASSGLYWFKKAETFLRIASLKLKSKGECYIAPLYNQMIKEGACLMAKPLKRFYCYGTPDDLHDATINGKYYIYNGVI